MEEVRSTHSSTSSECSFFNSRIYSADDTSSPASMQIEKNELSKDSNSASAATAEAVPVPIKFIAKKSTTLELQQIHRNVSVPTVIKL